MLDEDGKGQLRGSVCDWDCVQNMCTSMWTEKKGQTTGEDGCLNVQLYTLLILTSRKARNITIPRGIVLIHMTDWHSPSLHWS